MAGSDACTGDVDHEVSRWKTFYLDGHHWYYDDSRKLQQEATPWRPPNEKTFNLMFFKHLFDHMAKASGSSQVSVVALRNMSARIMEIMQLGDPMKVDFFGDLCTHRKLTWNDMCRSLLDVGHLRVRLTPTERIFVTLEVEDSSFIAKVWFYIVMTVTIANVSVFIWPQLLAHAISAVGMSSSTDEWSLYFKNACMAAPWLKVNTYTLWTALTILSG